MAESSAGNSSSSKSLMWMMLALFAGLGTLVGGGLFVANRVVRSLGITVSTNNKETIRTPAGTYRMQKAEQVGPNLPVYPKSSLELPGENLTATAIKEAQNGLSTVIYHSGDTRESVDMWYTQHLGQEFTRHGAGETPVPEAFQNTRVTGSDIAFVAVRGTQVRMVALSVDSTGTMISLIRGDKTPPSQNP